MAKKYLKNSEGIVRAVTSDNLGLEKPLLNENYNIEVHNRNMDKIDSAIQEVKGKIDGLELVASNVKMVDGTTVEDTVEFDSAIRSSVASLKDEIVLRSRTVAELLGAEFETTSDYPEWQYDSESKVRGIFHAG